MASDLVCPLEARPKRFHAVGMDHVPDLVGYGMLDALHAEKAMNRKQTRHRYTRCLTIYIVPNERMPDCLVRGCHHLGSNLVGFPVLHSHHGGFPHRTAPGV